LTRKKKGKRRPVEGRDEATEGELGRWPDLAGLLQGCSSSSPIGWMELLCPGCEGGRYGEATRFIADD